MNPLTERQLEAAARELCRLLDVDPESILAFESKVYGKPWRQWQEYADMLETRDLETIALSVGRQHEG